MLDRAFLTRRNFAMSIFGLMGAPLLAAGCIREPELQDPETSSHETTSPIPGSHTAARLPEGELAWDIPLKDCASRPEDIGFITQPITKNDNVFLCLSGEIVCFGSETGSVVFSRDLGEHKNELAACYPCDDAIIVVRGDATIWKLSPTDGSTIWSTKTLNERYVYGNTQSYDEDGTATTMPLYADVSWYITHVLTHKDLVIVGFSSYSVDPGSHLTCLNLDDGSICWDIAFPGRFTFQGGVAQPLVTPHGVLVPTPEEPSLTLLSYTDGSERARIELDTPIGLPITPYPDQSNRALVQTMTGTLYEIEFGENSLSIIHTLASDISYQDAPPSQAGACIVGTQALCNALSTTGTSCARIELETFSFEEPSVSGTLQQTPILLQDEEGAAAIYAFINNTLNKAPITLEGIGSFEKLASFDGIVIPDSTAPLAIDAEGRIFLLSDSGTGATLMALH